MYHYVYKTINPINKKFYIGKHSTNSLQDNYQGSGIWIKKAKKSNTHLITGIISYCKTEKQAYKLEETLVTKCIKNSLNMNFKYGGLGNRSEDQLGSNNTFYGKTHTKESKKKMGRNVSGSKNPMYGKTHTKEAIENIKKKISILHTGVPKTEEHKKKMSLARKNFWAKKRGEVA